MPRGFSVSNEHSDLRPHGRDTETSGILSRHGMP